VQQVRDSEVCCLVRCTANRNNGVGAYVLPATGQTWAEVKRLWIQGVKTYIGDMWNIVEFATISLYITAFTLKFVSWFLVNNRFLNVCKWYVWLMCVFILCVCLSFTFGHCCHLSFFLYCSYCRPIGRCHVL